MTPPPRHWPYNPDGPRDDALDVRSWRLGGAEWARAASTVAVAAAWGGAVRVAGEGAAAEMVAVRKDLGLGEALRSFVEWCEEGGEDESVWEVKECGEDECMWEVQECGEDECVGGPGGSIWSVCMHSSCPLRISTRSSSSNRHPLFFFSPQPSGRFRPWPRFATPRRTRRGP